MPIERSAGGGGGGGFTNPMTTKGDVIIENAVPAPDRLGIGSTGQVLNVAAGLPAWATPPGFEINYTERTSDLNITSTNEAAPTTLLSPGAVTFDGQPVMLEFYGLIVSSVGATDVLGIVLFEGGSELARIALFEMFGASGTGQFVGTIYGGLRFTPTAASHTYVVGAFVNNTTGTPHIAAGAVGAGGNPPCYVRFVKV